MVSLTTRVQLELLGCTLSLAPNLLKINKKGLLFLEQSLAENGAFSLGAPDEIRTHIDGTGNHNSIH
jgi:hypothetical protein